MVNGNKVPSREMAPITGRGLMEVAMNVRTDVDMIVLSIAMILSEPRAIDKSLSIRG